MQHLAEAVDSGGGLLGDSADFRQQIGKSLMNDLGQIPAVIQQHIGAPISEAQRLLDAPFVLFFGFSLPGEYRHSCGSDRRRGVILGGKDIMMNF